MRTGLKCVSDALKIVAVEAIDQNAVSGVCNMPLLVGGRSDGATLNVSQSNGLKGMMLRVLPWLYSSW